MAIGDAVAIYLGTTAGNRQPSAGVEEQISGIVKTGNTDPIGVYDGTNLLDIMIAGVTSADTNAAASQRFGWDMNLAIMIDNSIYLRKTGGTDRFGVHGVQTNA